MLRGRQDNNVGLLQQCLHCLSKRSIHKLTQTYLTLSLADLAAAASLSSAREAELCVLRLIEAGEIFATIDQKDGMARTAMPSQSPLDVLRSPLQLPARRLHICAAAVACTRPARRHPRPACCRRAPPSTVAAGPPLHQVSFREDPEQFDSVETLAQTDAQIRVPPPAPLHSAYCRPLCFSSPVLQPLCVSSAALYPLSGAPAIQLCRGVLDANLQPALQAVVALARKVKDLDNAILCEPAYLSKVRQPHSQPACAPMPASPPLPSPAPVRCTPAKPRSRSPCGATCACAAATTHGL